MCQSVLLRAKQKPVHCLVMSAKKNHKNVDVDYHAGDSHREGQCQQDPEILTITTPGQNLGQTLKTEWFFLREICQLLENWKRLEHQAPGDWLLQKIVQVQRKLVPELERARILRIKCWVVFV